MEIKGLPIDQKHLDNKEWDGNPLQTPVRIEYKEMEDGTPYVDNPSKKTDDMEEILGSDDWDWAQARFTPADLTKIDSRAGKFVFMNKVGQKLVLSKIKEKSYSYMDAF
jgi:hypothetical protein